MQPNAGSLWNKVNQWIGDELSRMLGTDRVTGTVEGGVIVGEGDEQRTIPKAIGMPMQPGDQVVIIRFGRVEVAAFAVSRIGSDAPEVAPHEHPIVRQNRAVATASSFSTAGTRTLATVPVFLESGVRYAVHTRGYVDGYGLNTDASVRLEIYCNGVPSYFSAITFDNNTSSNRQINGSTTITGSGGEIRTDFKITWFSGALQINYAEIYIIATPVTYL